MQAADKHAYDVLQENFAGLCNSALDPIKLGNELFSLKIITKETLDQSSVSPQAKHLQLKTLFSAVMQQGQPGTFEKVVRCIDEDGAFAHLTNKLKASYAEKCANGVARDTCMRERPQEGPGSYGSPVEEQGHQEEHAQLCYAKELSPYQKACQSPPKGATPPPPQETAHPVAPPTITAPPPSSVAPPTSTTTQSVDPSLAHLLGKHQLRPEDLDDVFSYVQAASPKWKDISRNLKMSSTETRAIVNTTGLTDQKDYFQEMLGKWLTWAPPQHPIPTTEALAEAIGKAGSENLAFKLKKEAMFVRPERVITPENEFLQP